MAGTTGVEVVATAQSIDDLLALIGGDTPDVLLLDVNLPGLSGIDGLGRIRAAGFTNPVVVMSADRRNEEPALQAGAAAFFYKGTTDLPRLIAEIRRAVTSH